MNADAEISLPFTPAEWQLFLVGLHELPMKHARPLVAKLERQLAEAQRPKPLKEKAS